MTDMHNFSNQKNRAINEMLNMSKRASQTIPNNCKNKPEKTKIQSKKIPNKNFLIANDDMLILGILLILAEDSCDLWLFLALIYILV